MPAFRWSSGALAALILGAVLASPAAAAPKQERLEVGSLVLRPCEGPRTGWCGTVTRRLDPTRNRPRIRIAFRWFPARERATGPALVAVEGGPGYPSGGSLFEYRGMYGPLLDERDLLLVDNRGTGGSALIDCRRLQPFTGRTSGSAFARRVGTCARQIDRRYGARVNATDLFATAYAVDDLAAIVRRLRLPRIDLYGDSYGTYFVQSFVARHPDRLNSVILDSAYPVADLDPWYASSGTAARQALDAVCARDPGCSAAAPGPATARLAQLLDALRRAPITGRTRDADGSAVRATVTVRAVADMVQDSASDPVILRELDASVRAALAGDPAPLLRLAAQSDTYDHGAVPADYLSRGLCFAVNCLDLPPLFSPQASPARRREQFAAALLDPPGDAFAPFTAAEWVQMSNLSQPYDGCLDWPRPVRRTPPLPAQPRPLPASVPILIIGGDLDSLTPVADAEAFGPALGARVRVIVLPNAVHVSSEGGTLLTASMVCARRLVRAFIRRPQGLEALDASCTARIPPVHTPGAYPVALAAAAPATLAAGPDPGETARRAATVAAGALADATVRHFYAGTGRGPGLRGGRFLASGDRTVRFRLDALRHVRDAAVDGTGTWRAADGAVRGRLTVRPAGGAPIAVEVEWEQRTPTARATVAAATLTLPAP
jgi:pimeloyl-ACP methyl ester carboxylesterase